VINQRATSWFWNNNSETVIDSGTRCTQIYLTSMQSVARCFENNWLNQRTETGHRSELSWTLFSPYGLTYWHCHLSWH